MVRQRAWSGLPLIFAAGLAAAQPAAMEPDDLPVPAVETSPDTEGQGGSQDFVAHPPPGDAFTVAQANKMLLALH